MRSICALVLLAAAILLVIPDQSDAIPAFARKYGFNCNMCHTAFTRLNDWGQRFRDNGYQVPGQVGGEKTVFDTPPPFAVRTTTGFSLYDRDSCAVKATTSTFGLYGLDVLAAGVLHKNVSFLMIYTPRIDEPAADENGPGSTGSNPSQVATLEAANLVFSNIVPGMLNLRIGRFEPDYHAISSKRTYYLFEPYEVYGFQTPGNCYIFDDNQVGIEATGHFKHGVSYGAGLVNGNGGNPDNNKYKDVYVDLAKTFGPGSGQTAGQRIGLFGYYGWQPAGDSSETFYRMGAAALVNWKTWHVQAFLVQGTDAKGLNDLKPDEDYDFTGGFAELSWAGLPNNRLVASAMYNWIAPPDYDAAREVKAYSGVVRYYLGNWTAVNVALHTEFTHRETGKDHPLKENELALIVDFDF